MESQGLGLVKARFSVVRGEIEPGKSLAETLAGSVSDREIRDLQEVARPDFDLAHARPGQPFRVSLNNDGSLHIFAYVIDDLRTLRVSRRNGGLRSNIASRTYESRIEVAEAVIRTDLFDAMEEIGERSDLALELADVFGWNVDFNTAVRGGDSFRVAVEKVYLDGELKRYGRILAAEFEYSGRSLMAIRYEGRDGKASYFEPSGEPLKRVLLRSPLRFNRVSSRFSRNRFHPILHTSMAHNGTDLAAAYGTPVRSIGDGQVLSAGYQGGYGNLVVVRHAGGYVSYYGHLSRILVRAGRHVSQNEFVGLVGATGLATAPHLHYAIRKDGAWTDPMRMTGPSTPALEGEDLAKLQKMTARALTLLPPRPVAEAQVW